MSRLAADLWHGRVPLARAFWEYAIAYGTVLNLLATIAAFALIAGGDAGIVTLVVFFLPAPYNLLMIVAVWRSATRYEGPQHWSVLARALILVWAAVVTLA